MFLFFFIIFLVSNNQVHYFLDLEKHGRKNTYWIAMKGTHTLKRCLFFLSGLYIYVATQAGRLLFPMRESELGRAGSSLFLLWGIEKVSPFLFSNFTQVPLAFLLDLMRQSKLDFITLGLGPLNPC